MKMPEPSRLRRSLDDEEIEYLLECVKKGDNPLIEIFSKLIRDGKKSIYIPTPEDVTYVVRRTYADGQLKELDWLDSILNWSE